MVSDNFALVCERYKNQAPEQVDQAFSRKALEVILKARVRILSFIELVSHFQARSLDKCDQFERHLRLDFLLPFVVVLGHCDEV